LGIIESHKGKIGIEGKKNEGCDAEGLFAPFRDYTGGARTIRVLI
jgi:hypothetical protein